MIVIGVTGGLGTGKSTVARMFGQLGAVVIDADRLAHEVMEPKRLAWRQIIHTFGEGVLNDDRTINRKKLGERVFRDPEARRQLEAIVHPRAIRRIKERLKRLARNRRVRNRWVRAVVLDVPLLVETGSEGMVDVMVVVTAPPEVQQERLSQRGMSIADIAQRRAAQWDVSAKVGLADHVVDNGNGMEQTRRQVKDLWNQLLGTRRRQRG